MIKNLFERESVKSGELGLSQLHLPKGFDQIIKEAFGNNPYGKDDTTTEFEKRLDENEGFNLKRVSCLFAAVGTAINHLAGERIVNENHLINAIAFAVSHNRAPIEKDPNPADRYYEGVWKAFNKIGFYHQAAIPLVKAFDLNMLSVDFTQGKNPKKLKDLMDRIQVENAAICISVSNIGYLKARFKDLIMSEGDKIFYPARVNGKIEYVELVPDSHLVFIKKMDDGDVTVYDSFNIPISESQDAPLSYTTSQEFLGQFLTGKALIITGNNLSPSQIYTGTVIPIKIPEGFIVDIPPIRA